MSTQAAAPAETAATPEALPSNPSQAAAKFVEKREAAGSSNPKAGATAAGTAGETGSADSAKTGSRAEKTRRLDPNIVRREREATEATQRANAIEAKHRPLQEALAKKDLKGALNLMAKDHGVTFADFVSILTDAGDPEETLDVKAARIARETIDKAKAEDAAKAAEEAKAKAAEEDKAIEARVEKVKGLIAEKAESDTTRWELSSLDPVVTKDDEGRPIVASDYAWRIIEAEHSASGKTLSFEEALDLVEGKLRTKREAQRAKQGARDQSATGQAREQADGQASSGRADGPRINNSTTSGATGVRPARDPNAKVTFGKSAVEDAIARAGIRV